MRVYEVFHKPTGFRDDDRAFVVANTATQAKALAKKYSSKVRDWEYVNIRVKLVPSLAYITATEKPEDFTQEDWEDHLKFDPPITEPSFLFDNETYEDVLEEERRWFDSQCL